MKLQRRAISAAVLLGAAMLVSAGTASAQNFPGGIRGEDRNVLAQFDKDHDGRLNTAERQVALNALGFQSGGRGGNRGWGPAEAGVKLAPADVKNYPASVPLYDPTALRTLFVEFEDADWEAEMEAFYRTDIDIPARVTVDGKIYKDVGVHFRGNSSYSSVPTGYKRSLDLNFDYVDAKQKLYGHHTLNLLNANEDPTFMRGVIALEVARSYIMAPKANFARVVINGENWGVYENVEQFNDEMTREWFGSGKDARWKVLGTASGGRGGLAYLGDSPAAYQAVFEMKSKDDPEQWKALIAMIRTLTRTPPEQLESALAGVLDIDGALKFLAVDNVLVNGDGYWAKGGDYAIYRDPKGVFHVLPHDVNEYFMATTNHGGSVTMSPLVSQMDPDRESLGYHLLAVPALKERYLGYVRELSQTWLDWKKMGPIVQAYSALIHDDVMRDTKKLFFPDEFLAGVADQPGYGARISLRSFVDRRKAYLDTFGGGESGKGEAVSGKR